MSLRESVARLKGIIIEALRLMNETLQGMNETQRVIFKSLKLIDEALGGIHDA